jgi:TolB-like protein
MIRSLVALALAVPLAAQAAPRTKLAVMDVRAVQGVAEGTVTILTAIIVSDAARAGYDVISQADVSAMIGFEKQKQMLGCTDQASCLAEIGGALGVDYVVSGQVGQIGSRYHLSLQLLDSRKAKVLARGARFAERNEDALAAAAQATLADLLGAVERGGAPPVAGAAAAKPAGTPAKPDLSAPASAAVAPKEGQGWRPSRKASYWVMGGGATALLVGALFKAGAASETQKLEDAWQDPDYASLYEDKKARIEQLSTVGNSFLVGGALVTGVGAFMWWKGRPLPVAVAPAIDADSVGLVAAGRF